MPLLKRKADGQFEDWRGSSAAASSPPQPTSTGAPSAKRPKLSAEHPTRARVSPRKARKDASRSSTTPARDHNDWFADKDNGYSSQPAASSSQRPSQAPPMHKPPPSPPPAAIHLPTYKPPPPPQPSPSKVAKTPKPKTPAKSKEKRQARFRSAAPQAILQRLDRVAAQRSVKTFYSFTYLRVLQIFHGRSGA